MSRETFQAPITMVALVFAGTDLLISLGRCEKRNTCKKEAKHASMKNIAEFLIWRLQHVLAEFIKKGRCKCNGHPHRHYYFYKGEALPPFDARKGTWW